MTEVRAKVSAIKNLIWLVGCLVSIAVVALTYFVAARVVRPVVTLTDAAEAIAAGDYQQHVYFDSRDELGALAHSFNRMSDQLESRETQLRESSQRLTTVLEGMAEGVVSLDDRQRIVLANAAAGGLLGFSPEQELGRPLLEVVRNHALHAALVQSQASRESRRVEIELGDGENRALSIYVTLVPGERKTRFILVLQDITELRRLESMRQEFVANVSHELKTPLSSIKAYAETLSQGAINDSQNNLRFVHRIEDQAERLHQLILDLLSLARIESGKEAFEIAPVNIESIVLSCLAEHQAGAESKGVQLITESGESDLKVRADEEGTRQILNNLINNAVNYTPPGGHVKVGWRTEDAMGVLEVSDSGVGIAAEHLPRLFERFYRVDKARSRELGGTGLGLSIVKHLTQSFGGHVEVESEPGVGTMFTVRIPRA
jgi:two-component system phosphate regulon sensor histidine kinase PhoR